MKFDLWDGYATGFLGVLSQDGIEVVSNVWEGPFPGRERTVRLESKGSIFNRIAASEGASTVLKHGFPLSHHPPLCGCQGALPVSFMKDAEKMEEWHDSTHWNLQDCASPSIDPFVAAFGLSIRLRQHPSRSARDHLGRVGIPHIFAGDLEAASYAWGWAQARNHGALLVKLFGEARGGGAEYWGSDLVEQDTWMRRVGIPKRGEKWYSEQEPEARRVLDAFVQGINDFLVGNPEQVPDTSRAVLPILPGDVLAHANRVIHFRFLSNPQSVLSRLRTQRDSAAGSNAWAVAPSSDTSPAMLLINPHLPWSGLYTWMEGHITTQGMNLYGAALLGMRFMAVGFNDYLGWTHTVNTIDASDLYQLRLQGDGYLWNGGVEPFEVSHETMKVLQDDGTHAEVTLELKASVHGPVFQVEDRAIALRVAGLERSQMLQQYLDMSRSRNLNEFEEVVARLQMPMFTLIYADREGHILSLFGGVVPRRPSGDWDWSGVVPGTSSETLWNETHVYGELPRVLDPPSGWVQNANEPPWTTTLPYVLDPADFPPYMAPRGMAFRPQSSVRLVSDKPATLEDLVVKANSTHMELADRIMDDLLPVLEAGTLFQRRSAETLQARDRTADAASRGGVLFSEFWNRLQSSGGVRGVPRRGVRRDLFALPWDLEDPRKTPMA